MPSSIAAEPAAVVPSDGPTTHLIVMAHGIEGTVRDLHAIRDEIYALRCPGIECFDTKKNHYSGTHAGIMRCADQVWSALEPKLR